jgi:hypothetical protein
MRRCRHERISRVSKGPRAARHQPSNVGAIRPDVGGRKFGRANGLRVFDPNFMIAFKRAQPNAYRRRHRQDAPPNAIVEPVHDNAMPVDPDNRSGGVTRSTADMAEPAIGTTRSRLTHC